MVLQSHRLPDKTLGARRRRCRRWVRQQFRGALRDLIQEYTRAPVVLYTGAGVSVGPPEVIDGRVYGLLPWTDLLRELVGSAPDERWPSDPWRAADHAV